MRITDSVRRSAGSPALWIGLGVAQDFVIERCRRRVGWLTCLGPLALVGASIPTSVARAPHDCPFSRFPIPI